MDLYDDRPSFIGRGAFRSVARSKCYLAIAVVGICALTWTCVDKSGSYVTLNNQQQSDDDNEYGQYHPNIIDLDRHLSIPNTTQDDIKVIGGAVTAMQSQLDSFTTSIKAQLDTIIQREQELTQQLTAIQQHDEQDKGMEAPEPDAESDDSPSPRVVLTTNDFMHGGDQFREFLQNHQEGNGISRWSGYFNHYGRHFNRFRSQDKVVMIEVGVQSGGCIDMWRDYFGADRLEYYGIEINPEAKNFERPGVTIIIGDQSKVEFWEEFKSTYPMADIFIDDGGHQMNQQITTFKEMFFHVKDSGVYLCEDLHTSYWEEYHGAYKDNGTMLELVKSLVDTINAWHSRDDLLQVDELTRNIEGMHIYDSMAFIDKLEVGPMTEVKAGDKWIPCC